MSNNQQKKEATGGYIFPDSAIPFFKDWAEEDFKDRDWKIRWEWPGFHGLVFYD